MLIGKYGPIGVVDLATRVGRDYTTASRQVARLEQLGLVTRRTRSGDRRSREATLTPEGKASTDAVDAARERLALKMFKSWSRDEYDQLLRLTRMLADGLYETPAPGSKLAESMAQMSARRRAGTGALSAGGSAVRQARRRGPRPS